MRLPIEFEKAMRDLLKDEYDAYEKSLDQPYFGGLRGNELKVDGKRLQEIVPFQLETIPWVHNGFYFLSGEQPAKDPYYHAGLYYIQEPSAMTPASILPVSPGDKILDLCAAPGGKSTQLGAKLGNTGLLVCNDISPSRAKAIVKNIEIFGIKNALVLSESPKKLESYFEGFFDKVLVDAPCSGEGMFRKDPSMVKNWEEMGVAPYVALQKEILPSADKMLKSGGYMVYSTCTFSLEENERMMRWFMETYPNYELIKIPQDHGFSEGREGLTEAVRLFPHKLKGEGHFVVLLHKKAAQINERPIENAFEPPSVAQLVDFNNFEETHLNFTFDRNQLMLLEDHLYLLPKGLPSLKGLRVLKSGWALGELKKNRFVPSQAFASGLRKNEVKNVLTLEYKDAQVIKYLKGETLNQTATEGYNMICVENFPLGWAKKAGNVLKNKYSPGWRWQ